MSIQEWTRQLDDRYNITDKDMARDEHIHHPNHHINPRMNPENLF